MPPDNSDENQYPFLAPCKHVTLGAPFRWLRAGFADVRNALFVSLSYGLIMTAMVMTIFFVVLGYGSGWMTLMLLCLFVFLAPLMCVGVYSISAQLERGQTVSFRRTLRACLKRYIGSELVFVLALLIIFLVWGRATSMVSIFIPATSGSSFAHIVPYALALSAVSSLFLALIFASSVFSLPMIMHRDIDTVTAIATSINAVLRNKIVMAEWAILISFLCLIGLLTFGAALVILLPTIGHAVWYGYIETIDASEFPRHKTGITSVSRHSE